MNEQEVIRAGLLGWPVAHSVSPAMHNAAFRALGLPWHYDLLPVPPDELAAAVAGLEGRGFCGANVTVPHKEAALGLVDEADAGARAIGAVNTLVRRGDGWLGTNTDAAGFVAALRDGGFEPAGRQALVLGAGGAARAVVHALAGAGCAVIVHNRTAERAARLCADLGAAAEVPLAVAQSLTGLDPDAVDLLVNATPLGQWPAAGGSPWPQSLPLPAHWTVFDLVYNPLETRLLARARAAGAIAVDGLEMLVHQGALSFTLWTGRAAPLDVMRAAARQAVA
ncbi:MAG: shikimate dehydrogenase [Anaerolineae bacterium]